MNNQYFTYANLPKKCEDGTIKLMDDNRLLNLFNSAYRKESGEIIRVPDRAHLVTELGEYLTFDRRGGQA